MAALFGGFIRKESLGKQEYPEQFLQRLAGPEGTAHILGCALLTNSMLRAGLGLEGGQLGSEDDTRSTVTALSRDKVCKQHVQHSEANPCAM